MVTEDDYRRRLAYEHQSLVVADMTRHRLDELDRRYAAESSEDPEQLARHAAVRDELRRRGYHILTEPAGKASASAS